jgi:hypothetical protein
MNSLYNEIVYALEINCLNNKSYLIQLIGAEVKILIKCQKCAALQANHNDLNDAN